MRLPWLSRPRRGRHKSLVDVPFVGRERVLSELDQQVKAVQQGGTRFVALEGESGSGKSALLKEFAYAHSRSPDVLFARLVTGAWLLEAEFYATVFDVLRSQSEQVLDKLYKETKRHRKLISTEWDEREFRQFLMSTDWSQYETTPPPIRSTRIAGRSDPLRQLLAAVSQHPWAIGSVALLGVLSRLALNEANQPSWLEHWVALLHALKGRVESQGTALVLTIDHMQDFQTDRTGQERWVAHWHSFVTATRESASPVLVVWAGTPEGLQAVKQAGGDLDALTVCALGELDDNEQQSLLPRLQRMLPHAVQPHWQRDVTPHSMWSRYPGVLLLAAFWMAAKAETQDVEGCTLQAVEPQEVTALIRDLLQLLIRAHAEVEALLQQLLEVCVFWPPGKMFALEEMLPRCDLAALGFDPIAGRIAVERLLRACVRVGLLGYDAHDGQFSTGSGMIQHTLQCLVVPDVIARQTLTRRRRLSDAVIQHLWRGQGVLLEALAGQMTSEASEQAPDLAPYLISPVRRILMQSSKDEKQRMAQSLGRFHSPLGVDFLMTLLNDEDEHVRSRAAQSLADLDGLDTSSALLKASRDPNSDVRWIAAMALGKINSTSVVTALIEMLTDEDKEVGRIAAQGLGAQGDSRAVPHLIAVTRDRYPILRERAAYALGQLADRRAVPALQELQQDSNRQVRQCAEEALACFPPSSC